jgi:hypothetical protein
MPADDADASVLAAEVLTAALERAVAGNELRSLGIEPSPSDVEHYLAMTQRERRAANVRWAVMKAAGLFSNPA